MTLCTFIFYIQSPKKNPLTLPSLTKSEIALIAGTAFIIFIVGMIALVAPPNNWDSMTYHMTRVAHWIQNRNVDVYPTHILRQVTYPAGAEYAILHLQILTGSDRFANCVQWLSMIGSVIGVSLIAKQLGANRLGQIASAVIAVTIPMGILQASSTQNDYVTAFWLICLVHFVLRAHDESSWLTVIAIGTSTGLAFFTKGTAYLYAAPFLIWFLWSQRRCPITQILAKFLTIIGLIVVINSGFYARNYAMNQTFLPPSESENMINNNISISAFISNTLRNTGLHLGSPVDRLTKMFETSIYKIHDALDIDIRNPQTTMSGAKYEIPHALSEDITGNFRHLWLIAFSIIAFFISPLRKNKTLFSYLIACLFMIIIFNLLLKWSLFHSRYHLAIFLMFAPLIGTFFSQQFPKKIVILLCIFLILTSLPWVFRNSSRPIISKKGTIFSNPRNKQYFANKRDEFTHYNNATQYIKSLNCRDVGLLLNEDNWEYPFWVFLNNDPKIKYRLESVNVRNSSAPRPEKALAFSGFNPRNRFAISGDNDTSNFDPCVIISLYNHSTAPTYLGENFVKTRSFDFIDVLVKDNSGGVLKKQNLITLFNEVMNLAKQDSLYVPGGPKSPQEIIYFRRNEWDIAKAIDRQELNKIYPQLGDYFTNLYLRGLEVRLIGYAKNDKDGYILGQEMINHWNEWLVKHLEEIKEGFGKYTSQ